MTFTELGERLLALLLADYGLDGTRGGMARTLARYARRRLAALEIDEAELYGRILGEPDERRALVRAVTVKHSWMFRDPRQLDELGEFLEARARERGDERPLDVWVAGCATGEEAWTVAMIAAARGLPINLLATDLDDAALAEARAGRYGAWSLRELPPTMTHHVDEVDPGVWTIADSLRQSELVKLEFAVHNLCEPPPRVGWDVICCRNVLIYFAAARAHAVVARLRESLGVGGRLLLGAGDLLFQLELPTRAPGPRPQRSPALRPPLTAVVPVPAVAPRLPDAPALEPTPEPAIVDEGFIAALTRAAELVERGDNDQAVALLDELAARDPLIAETHLWAGLAHFGAGRTLEAGEALRRARCLEPQLWPATLFAALTHERRGQWSAAERCWADLLATVDNPSAPTIEGTPILTAALDRWHGEALALARQRSARACLGERSLS